MTNLRLLAGPHPSLGAESIDAHVARLGAAPNGGHSLIDTLQRSELRGRGGAAFPAAVKWRAVAERGRGRATVVANGAEGEPLSWKDRVLMEARPHLVIDGAVLAADSVGASNIVLYLGEGHQRAVSAMRRAVSERSDAARMRVLTAPVRYVTGEESAAVHYINDGVALPQTVPPRPFERGVGGRPTLVQNVETLAHVALIARYGDEWFRDSGGDAPGTVLLTLTGGVAQPGVVEVAQGTALSDAVQAAGGALSPADGVLLGGFFGRWVDVRSAWDLRLDAEALRVAGLTLGCGVVSVLAQQRCGVAETARIAAYLASQSARQCGPCVFGLSAIAGALRRIADGSATGDDLVRLRRWTGELPGRGACHHPDGAAGLVGSALRVFAEEFALHEQRRCSAGFASAVA